MLTLLGLFILIGMIVMILKVGFWIGYGLAYLILALIVMAIIYGILKIMRV